MAEAQRFTFDREFGRNGQSAKMTAPLKCTLSNQELEAIKQAAFQEGVKAAEAQSAGRAAEELGALVTKLGALCDGLDEATRGARAEAIKLAYLIARRLAPSLIAARPEAEIESLITQCIEEQREEPNIVIRVNDGLLENVKAQATRLAQEHSFAGRILVIGEPQIAEANCTIEWANGGVERDFSALTATIDEVVRTYLRAEGMNGADFPDQLSTPDDERSDAMPVDGGK